MYSKERPNSFYFHGVYSRHDAVPCHDAASSEPWCAKHHFTTRFSVPVLEVPCRSISRPSVPFPEPLLVVELAWWRPLVAPVALSGPQRPAGLAPEPHSAAAVATAYSVI